MKIALLCGGPSRERGISLNSARSILDHLSSEQIEIVPVYFDGQRRAYAISAAQLYSNTPSDFDFKLQQTARPLTERALVRLLKKTDIAFPVMHGPFGEDGGIQTFLERHRIPFVGSSAAACKRAFDKFTANQILRAHGFFALPSALLKIYHRDHRAIIGQFFRDHRVKRAVVKPATGGSSIGVFSVSTPAEALDKARLLFSKRMDTRVVIEPFATGIEFTTIILENRFGLPVTLIPTEIETDYTKHQIFDYRRKYLPTRQVIWHCPPRFSNETIETIRTQAEQLFALFNLRDFGRFDGWVRPDGKIWFCDFNTVSGMEQNSFLFQQASRVGLTHTDVLRYILDHACRRYAISFPEPSSGTTATDSRKPVHVLFGGRTSERQVSLMSGTNVWLKLRGSKRHQPKPFLLDTCGTVWELPYHLALNHTVEEIMDNCRNYQRAGERLALFERGARHELGLQNEKNRDEFFKPRPLTLEELIERSPFVFNALHGGIGENGTLQASLAKHGVPFNGPDERVSRLCIDKWATRQFVEQLDIKGVSVIPGSIVATRQLQAMTEQNLKSFWKTIRKKLGAASVIVKPRADGCSTGVVHLFSSTDLRQYLKALDLRVVFVPKHTFTNQRDILEMPTEPPAELLFERYVATDRLQVKHNQLRHRRKTGWIEITVGVVERDGMINVMNPSITIAEGEVLTVEEKFQGGTGVNITPPPPSIVKPKTLQLIRERIQAVATGIGIRGYARVDAFAHARAGDILIIEINTLPALTPSTVFYQQALAEKPPVFPSELLELLIQNKGY